MRQLFRFIDRIMELPPALEEHFRQELNNYQEEKRMPFIDMFEHKGLEEGLLAGIEVSLEVKFGAEGLALLPGIQAIQDHEVLRSVLQAIKTAASPDELRRVWVRRRPKKKRGM